MGNIRPTPCSRDYHIKITCDHVRPPGVVSLTRLESRPGEALPHIYRDGSLCLHEAHEWTPAMALVDTVVPWTAEWLAHYELWKVRGRWYGDDVLDNSLGPVPTPPTEPNNRAERRRVSRLYRIEHGRTVGRPAGPPANHDRGSGRHRSQWEAL